MSARVCRKCGPYYSTLHDCPTAPLSPAPALTAEEAARVAVFDAAEEPEEIVVERVARAMFERPLAESASASWHEVSEGIRLSFRADARVAVAALRGDRGAPAPEPVAHNHTRFRHVDGGPWSPCPVSCPAAGLLR